MAKADSRRKVLAVLAGGLVLGVGAAVTLAAWNDSEFATGTFTAGAFNLQGSTTGDVDEDYGDHATAGAPAELVFTAGFANMAPGDVTYSPFWVRLDAATTADGTLSAVAPTSSGLNAANLSYSVYDIASTATCDATAATAGTLVASGASLSAFTAGADVALTAGAAGVAGEAAQLCFVVTAGDDLVQAETATATWQFDGVSN